MAYILVVDDNEVIRDVVNYTLHKQHDVTLANNADDAIKLTQEKQFDLIITDIKMPGMNGLDFVKEIRKNSSYTNTPILVLTANLPDYKGDIKESGASGWIIKPFKPEELQETVTKVLK